MRRKIWRGGSRTHRCQCKKEKKKEIIGEAADTLYHMLVLLRSKNISINEVLTELASREGVSGIEEKRKRNLE